MTLLILGLIVFLGTHSIRLIAGDWRESQIQRRGLGVWKAMYSVLSVAGLALIVSGYAAARAEPVLVWAPPEWTRHITALLTLVSFILLAAAYVPGNGIKAHLGHPMVAGVFVWAVAHLMSNGYVADLVLFECFLIWSAVSFRRSRKRDQESGIRYPEGNATRTIITVVVGSVAWIAFALFLHAPLIGVKPF